AAAEQKAQEEAEAQAAAEQRAAEQRAAEQRAAEQRAQEEAEAQAAAEEAEQAQPAAATPVSSASNGTNYYTWGSCAWYVFEKRSSMGMSVGNGWGDAKSWASNAQAAGYSVNNTPSVGSIMQAPAYTNGSYGQGHVAIVERVNGDGSILVSEMQFGGGLGDKSTRTISASNVSSHNFIH
ncbi:MAG: CHAP domain-containing protein, partial [Jeotgalicoccus halophilus]|nr:CHAP domain-containing protein [Jeotgalicoccus aerolatus]